MRLLPTTALAFALVRESAAIAMDELSHLSPASIIGLQEAANERVTYTTIALFSMPTFVLWCLFYLSAKSVEWALARFTKSYRDFTFGQKRTTVMYVLNAFWTAVALGVQLAAVGVFREEYTVKNIHCLRIVAIIISVNYLFELIYKESFRFAMLCHHFCTLAIIAFLVAAVQETQDPSIIVTASLWFLHATTEQPMFIALMMYRFKCSPAIVPRFLRVATAQALLVKVASTVIVFVWWGLRQARHNSPWEIAYSVVSVIAMISLVVVQFYGSSIVWKITDADLYRQKYDDYMSLRAGSGEVTRTPSLNGVAPTEKDADLADYGGSTSIAYASRAGATAHELV